MEAQGDRHLSCASLLHDITTFGSLIGHASLETAAVRELPSPNAPKAEGTTEPQPGPPRTTPKQQVGLAEAAARPPPPYPSPVGGEGSTHLTFGGHANRPEGVEKDDLPGSGRCGHPPPLLRLDCLRFARPCRRRPGRPTRSDRMPSARSPTQASAIGRGRPRPRRRLPPRVMAAPLESGVAPALRRNEHRWRGTRARRARHSAPCTLHPIVADRPSAEHLADIPSKGQTRRR